MNFNFEIEKEPGEGKIHFELTSFLLDDFDVNEDPSRIKLSMKPEKKFAPNQDIEIMYRRESSIASIQYVKTN